MNYLTIKEVAEQFNVTTKTIRRWMKGNGFPYYKPGGSLRFDPDDVKAWVKKQKEEAK